MGRDAKLRRRKSVQRGNVKVPKVDPDILFEVEQRERMRVELADLTVNLGFLNSMNALLGLYKDGIRHYGKTFNV
jgi:hypothetical protein